MTVGERFKTIWGYLDEESPDLAELSRRNLAGESLRTLAAELGVSRQALHQRLTYHGYPTAPPGPRRIALTEEARALLGTMPDSMLAKKLGVCREVISNHRKERGIPEMTKGMYRVTLLVGKRYGMLVVERYARKANSGHAKVRCRCDCGQICYVMINNLPRTKSCGCLQEYMWSHGGAIAFRGGVDVGSLKE